MPLSGMSYLHNSEQIKPSMVHQNIFVERVLIDEKFDSSKRSDVYAFGLN